MTNPAWGTKRCCQSCGVKYYDLNRAPILCPKCGTALDLASSTRLRSDPTYKPSAGRARSVFGQNTFGQNTLGQGAFGQAAPSRAAVADEDAVLADEADEVEDDSEEDVAEDVSELGGDEDDLAEIAEP